MMKKLPLIILSCWISTAGAFAGLFDSSIELENGYYYNDIGTTFISRKEGRTESQVIPEQVENYLTWRGKLLAVQSSNSLQYIILNMHTHQIERFDDLKAFKHQAKRIGLIDDNLNKLLDY